MKFSVTYREKEAHLEKQDLKVHQDNQDHQANVVNVENRDNRDQLVHKVRKVQEDPEANQETKDHRYV